MTTDEQPQLHKIGRISACIAGDYRYTTVIEAWANEYRVEVRHVSTSPVGGMDGPGGTFTEPARVVAYTMGALDRPLDAKYAASWLMDSLRGCFKRIDAGTVAKYGKPSKNFRWYTPNGLHVDGFNARLARLAFERKDVDL